MTGTELLLLPCVHVQEVISSVIVVVVVVVVNKDIATSRHLSNS